jgi:hypothetical protein
MKPIDAHEGTIDPGADATGADLYKAGLAYSTGQGAPLSYIEAHKWFNLAALAGVQEAKVYRRELAALMSSADIAAAQASARKWLTDAAHGRGRVSAPRRDTATAPRRTRVAA